MYRRTLVLRRFGPLSFGLGYFEDGIWVDHADAAGAGPEGPSTETDVGGAQLDAIHAWLDCCRDTVDPGPAMVHIEITAAPDSTRAIGQRIVPVARSASS
jgi:hypothetical protein